MRIPFLLFSLIGALLVLSCDPCRNVDCKPDDHNYEAQLRVVSRTDGKDLVFGPTRIYNKEAIKFYTFNGTDTTFFQCQPYILKRTEYDSILLVNFFPKANTAYMRLSNGDKDTLTFKYGTEQARCCVINVITELSFNDSSSISNQHGVIELSK
jgi:hypothetical protein